MEKIRKDLRNFCAEICLIVFSSSQLMFAGSIPSLIKKNQAYLDEPLPKARISSYSASEDMSQKDLTKILEKCADYCEKLANLALYYVCSEKIDEEIYWYKKVWNIHRDMTYVSNKHYKIEKNIYVYDYQIIKKGTNIEESRILLEENGKKKKEKNADLKSRRFMAVKPVFAPVGLLSKYWQNHHRYRVMKEDVIDGHKTLVIEAMPVTDLKENPNYGKIWVDSNDFSVLKVEMNQESLVNYEYYEKEAALFSAMPDITVSTFYGIEKNGIRFPSQIIFKEYYVGGEWKRRIKRSTMIINYEDYRFFTVEVKVKY